MLETTLQIRANYLKWGISFLAIKMRRDFFKRRKTQNHFNSLFVVRGEEKNQEPALKILLNKSLFHLGHADSVEEQANWSIISSSRCKPRNFGVHVSQNIYFFLEPVEIVAFLSYCPHYSSPCIKYSDCAVQEAHGCH